MIVTFYKELDTAFVINNVKMITKCSTNDVILTLQDNKEMTIKREQYTFFGVIEEVE